MPAPGQLSLFSPRQPARAARSGALVVLPDGARVAEHLEALLRERPLVAGRPACTIADLERALIEAAQERGLAPRVAQPAALELAFREGARERTPSGSPYSPIRARAGFAQALRGLSRVLLQGLLPPEELLRLAPELPEPSRSRLGALARVLCGVREELAVAGLAEPGEALRRAVDALAGGLPLPALLAQAAELRFEQVLDWTPLRLELACALAARLGREGAAVRIVLPYLPERGHLADDALGAVLRDLEARGARGPAPELVLEEPAPAPPLVAFASRLFQARRGPGAPEAAIGLRSCASPAAEAREAALRCARLLAEGAAPERIAVVARTLSDAVVDELGAALDRQGLPWRERRGRPASSTAPARLAASLPGLVERGFPREELAALLAAPWLALRAGAERAPPQAVARRLREARARDDRTDGGISARLAALAAQLRAQGAEEPRAAERLERQAVEVDEVRARAQRAIDALCALPARATVAGHAQALRALLEEWGFFRPPSGRIAEGPPGPLERAELEQLARDRAAIEAVEAALEQLARAAAALGRGRQELARAEFGELLAARLADLSLRPGGARGAAIELVELRELPGRAFDHLVFTGLLDGVLPAAPAVDPLLSDEDKRAVNVAARRAVFRAAPDGEALVLPPRQAEEPLLFLLGLLAARRTLLLLWPRADAQGREAARSPFVDEAARALGLPPAELGQAAAPLRPIPLPEACATAEELLARASLEAFAEPAWRISPPLPAAEARALAGMVLHSPLADRFRRVARAALAERERLRAFVGEIAPARFSGQLSGEALALARPVYRCDATAPLSASSLEEAATCPFRSYGHRVLGLEEPDPTGDDLAPSERGTLLHDCLEAFYGRLRAERRLPLRTADEAALLATLDEVARARMERFARLVPLGHRGLWAVRQQELLETLRRVVRADAAAGAEPLEQERRFGPGEEWPPVVLPAPDGSEALLLRGAIDRVDRSSDGLVVLDYKSSSRQSLARQLQTDGWLAPHYQLLLYAAALRARHPAQPVDAGYFSLKDAERTRTVRQAAEKRLDLAALLETDPALRAQARAKDPQQRNLADAAWELVGRLRAGTLPVQPLHCDWCDLKAVCRVVALPESEEET